MISIKRDSGYADRGRAYKIILDGEVIGKIENGQKLKLDAPSGKHQLYLRIDWCRSNFVYFEADGDIIEFECSSNLRGARILLNLLYITFLCKRHIWLRNM
jgi:hypothetical protein